MRLKLGALACAVRVCVRGIFCNFLSVVQIDAMITPDKLFIHHCECVIKSNQNHNEQANRGAED